MPPAALSRRFCLAPMMDWSDRHCRYFWRQMTRHALLYTEMITTGAILHGDREHLLGFDAQEHPVALQLGGSDPEELAACARIAQEYGYDEVNLNCGCPSDRVKNGRFGACLMGEPELVARCVASMRQACDLPVTVKHRTGIDDIDSEQALHHFVATIAGAGCTTFIVHARKAWLSGLSPKQNREIPPLQYDRVYRLKARFPELEIIVNGGIDALADCENHLQHVDGVMLGRAAYHNPWLLADVDHTFFSAPESAANREDVLDNMVSYIERQQANGVRINHITRHLLGLYSGQPGGRGFRRYISQNAHRPEMVAADLLQWRQQL